MKKLSYSTLAELGYSGYLLQPGAPEKVLQFGEGNFLRAFVDRFIDIANERAGYNGKVVLVQPIGVAPELADALNEQDCLYTVYVRGNHDGHKVDESRVISACSRCLNPYRDADFDAMMQVATSDELELIVSNTTEAGIAYDPACKLSDRPAASFPAKLCQVLYKRWQAKKSGLVVLSCELIDHNGEELLRIVKQYAADWDLEAAFVTWLDEECTFCTTLVDTIVPGRIRDAAENARLSEERGYEDAFADVREVFEMWGIQGSPELADKLPFAHAGLGESVFVVDDVTPYKKRKVRILNGAHTGFVPGAWLAGFNIVRDCMHDETVNSFMEKFLQQEVIPTLDAELDHDDLVRFASAVHNRFDNPFIDHQLLSICLNSVAKWRARDLPTLLDFYNAQHKLPVCLCTSLAALIAFYTSDPQKLDEDGLHLVRPDGTAYTAQDDASVLEFFWVRRADATQELVDAVLGNADMWGQDLREVPGLVHEVAEALAAIREQGCAAAFEACVKKELA